MIDNLLKKLAKQDTIHVANENSLVFMQDNILCHMDH